MSTMQCNAMIRMRKSLQHNFYPLYDTGLLERIKFSGFTCMSSFTCVSSNTVLSTYFSLEPMCDDIVTGHN